QADAPYVLEATLQDWLDIIQGKVNPLSAIMRRKLVLAKGSYSTIMRYPIAALEMVKAAQRVPVD
ncbi:MAG: SCP2 sterol-binding domain-containing protein, partial [Desulfurococcales archaeon]|nr:SCP2 sterol-binding domain-containing protein [Desulfurococcales archaeon]